MSDGSNIASGEIPEDGITAHLAKSVKLRDRYDR